MKRAIKLLDGSEESYNKLTESAAAADLRAWREGELTAQQNRATNVKSMDYYALKCQHGRKIIYLFFVPPSQSLCHKLQVKQRCSYTWAGNSQRASSPQSNSFQRESRFKSLSKCLIKVLSYFDPFIGSGFHCKATLDKLVVSQQRPSKSKLPRNEVGFWNESWIIKGRQINFSDRTHHRKTSVPPMSLLKSLWLVTMGR